MTKLFPTGEMIVVNLISLTLAGPFSLEKHLSVMFGRGESVMFITHSLQHLGRKCVYSINKLCASSKW